MAGDEDEVNERETKQEYNVLCDWIKQQLGDQVAKVQVSKRLSSSPCVLVSGKFGWSANMERSGVPTVINCWKGNYSFSLITVFEFLETLFEQVDESSNPWRYFEFRVYEGKENIGDQS